MKNENKDQFHGKLKRKMDDYVFEIYRLTKDFPRDELYGVTSQLRRAALSVILNYIEGYARQRSKMYGHFLRISYASLKEANYLVYFSRRQSYIKGEKEFLEIKQFADEIGAMLWATIENLRLNS